MKIVCTHVNLWSKMKTADYMSSIKYNSTTAHFYSQVNIFFVNFYHSIFPELFGDGGSCFTPF